VTATSRSSARSSTRPQLTPDTLHQFATLFNRMVDDFLAYDAEQGPGQP
jgi:hypothetical protein